MNGLRLDIDVIAAIMHASVEKGKTRKTVTQPIHF